MKDSRRSFSEDFAQLLFLASGQNIVSACAVGILQQRTKTMPLNQTASAVVKIRFVIR